MTSKVAYDNEIYHCILCRVAILQTFHFNSTAKQLISMRYRTYARMQQGHTAGAENETSIYLTAMYILLRKKGSDVMRKGSNDLLPWYSIF